MVQAIWKFDARHEPSADPDDICQQPRQVWAILPLGLLVRKRIRMEDAGALMG